MKTFTISRGHNLEISGIPSKKIINRQDSPELYLPNGGIYICDLKYYRDNFYSNKMVFFLMNKISSLDINDKDDFNVAKKNSKFLN